MRFIAFTTRDRCAWTEVRTHYFRLIVIVELPTLNTCRVNLSFLLAKRRELALGSSSSGSDELVTSESDASDSESDEASDSDELDDESDESSS